MSFLSNLTTIISTAIFVSSRILGTYIAIDHGIRLLETQNKVDVIDIIKRLRLDRGGMVQTDHQYRFVHNALIHHFMVGSQLDEPSLNRCVLLE